MASPHPERTKLSQSHGLKNLFLVEVQCVMEIHESRFAAFLGDIVQNPLEAVLPLLSTQEWSDPSSEVPCSLLT